MIYDVEYRVTDLRPEPVEGVVTLKASPGGLLMFEHGDGRLLEWDDDDPDAFVDDEKNGVLIVTTKTGSLLFTKVG